MVPALLALLLTQTPDSAKAVLLPSRVTGFDAARSAALSDDVAAQLKALEVPLAQTPAETQQSLRAAGMASSSECAGSRECIAKLGAVLRHPAVIAMDVGEVGGDLAFHLELVDTTNAARLAQS